MAETRVLVTNADYHHGLASVRSLGRGGLEVFAGSQTKYAQSFFSKYSSRKVIYPNPMREREFVRFIVDYSKDNKVDVVLPVGLDATVALSKHLKELQGVTRIPIAGWDSMQTAAFKDRTMQFAKGLGISTPTRFNSVDEVDSYPVVVKSVRSSGTVRYVNSEKELADIDLSDSLVQEYIPGDGYGFFALYNKGQLRASFMHRRLREYPITGGSSIAAESVRDSQLEESGLRLLDALRWHGVVMAEFKKDARDGMFKLMEINPKFWGSLELAIRSGVDFPLLAVKMASDGDVQPVFDYRVGVKFKWIFPDEILYAMGRPSAVPRLVSECLDRTFCKDISLEDIRPNLFQVLSTVATVAHRFSEGSVAHPHGIPAVRT